jgi:hypothetical protein
MVDEDDQCAGQNPPYGASINYYLKSVPKGDVKIRISDEKGNTVRSLKGTKEIGINRIWWDLRYESTNRVKLRTSPIEHPWVVPGPKGWRTIGRRYVIRGPLVVPGNYTVELTIGDKVYTQDLIVKKDPNTEGTEEDIRTQVKILLEIRENVNLLVDMVNQIEWVRKQIYDLKGKLKEDENNESIITAGEELDKKLIAVEENLFQMRLTGGTSTQDSLRWPNKYLSRISRIASRIAKSDFTPTIPQVEAHERYKKLLMSYRDQLEDVLNKDFKAFNKLLREKDIPNIILVKDE